MPDGPHLVTIILRFAVYGYEEILLHEFAAFAQPGALIATFLVLLMMGAGGAAMAIAARGWPF